MERRHVMPFGARPGPDGCHFGLWAPAAHQVEICLVTVGEELCVPMERKGDGWFETTTRWAPPGSLYRYRIDGGPPLPDPASRFQPQDVHGPSEVVDPSSFEWRDGEWRGRPWEEAVIYELHVGSFSPRGDFPGVIERLDHLVDLGVTAIELMPVAEFPGSRNWGYDGVLPFAPESRYGRPEDLKALVQEAHARRLMVFLDVVYNHFGPEGNYLRLYAPQFFTERHHTPWGAAINFDDDGSRWVRRFFIHNALYWLEEYHLDGLRLDAVHAILDDSHPDIVEEIARRVHERFDGERRVHLMLENERNQSRYLLRDTGRARHYRAQWNDDFHHALHVLITGEEGGYYRDFAEQPVALLGRSLAEGFAYQGEPSPYRKGERRGEPSSSLPPTAFIDFLQNHDQVGNRACGERITSLAPAEAVRAATAILLLAPSPPLLMMGEEWGTRLPFLFFCDFGPELAEKVRAGRRQEFADFPAFSRPEALETIPDPGNSSTYEATLLDWTELARPEGAAWLELHRRLLALRRRFIVPRLANLTRGEARWAVIGERGVAVEWRLGAETHLLLLANLGAEPLSDLSIRMGKVIFATGPKEENRTLPPWHVEWRLRRRPTTPLGAFLGLKVSGAPLRAE